MATTTQGRIFAQWVHGASAGSGATQTVTVNPNSRWVTAYASMRSFTAITPAHSHGAFGGGAPPTLDYGGAYISEVHWHDGDGVIQQWTGGIPYLAGGFVTKIKFSIYDCGAVLVINYWEF